MKTIYIVTSGDYSDYRINSVFDTRDKAEKFIEHIREKVSEYDAKYCTVEEWELNKFYSEIERGLRCFSVHYPDIENGDSFIAEEEKPRDGNERHWQSILVNRTDTNYMVYVWAKDKQLALKIANEKRVQYLASGRATQ